MPYSLRIIAPQYNTVNGLNGPEIIVLGDDWTPPASYTVKVFDDGVHQIWEDVNSTTPDAEILAAVPALIEERKQVIRAKGNEKLGMLGSPYMENEQKTWENQKQEAETWLMNPDTPTPMLTAMAENRGIPLSVMVEKIMENANLFKPVSGAILGIQQALLDRITQATTIDEVLAVKWE